MEQSQSDDGRQKKMKKDVMLVIGAGQIGMAIARRVGFGKKIILGDKNTAPFSRRSDRIMLLVYGVFQLCL
jgi:lactate dehydrogenase-like 2-hydroxyacid dehydrogenase